MFNSINFYLDADLAFTKNSLHASRPGARPEGRRTASAAAPARQRDRKEGGRAPRLRDLRVGLGGKQRLLGCFFGD